MWYNCSGKEVLSLINKDFSAVHLKNSDIKLLKKLYRKDTLPYSKKMDVLLKYDFANYSEYEFDEIGNHIPIKNKVEITDLGESFLLFRRKELFRFYFPTVLSICSLIISIVVAVHDFLC